MNFYPDTSMSFRANPTSLYPELPSISIEYPSQASFRTATPDVSASRSFAAPLTSPVGQKLSIPTFLTSPSRFLQNLPASPVSLLSPLIRRIEDDPSRTSASAAIPPPDYERFSADQINHYFLQRREYLQHQINLSMNISQWILEHLIFYSCETLRSVNSRCGYLDLLIINL